MSTLPPRTDFRLKLLRSLGLCFALVLSGNANAEVLTHTFSITGDNGETGSGTFTWDSDDVVSGTAVARSLTDTGALQSLTIQISGGNVIGGTTVFGIADCVGAYLEVALDFLTDINFWCNNGVNTLSGREENINYFNDTVDFGAGLVQPALGPGSSTLTFSAGTTRPVSSGATSIPVLPAWAMAVLVVLMTAIGARLTPRGQRRNQG